MCIIAKEAGANTRRSSFSLILSPSSWKPHLFAPFSCIRRRCEECSLFYMAPSPKTRIFSHLFLISAEGAKNAFSSAWRRLLKPTSFRTFSLYPQKVRKLCENAPTPILKGLWMWVGVGKSTYKKVNAFLPICIDNENEDCIIVYINTICHFRYLSDIFQDNVF